MSEERMEKVSLAARYEELRARAQRGEVTQEQRLLQQQGIPAWIESWRRCAPVPGAVPPRRPEVAAVVPVLERAALVQLVTGMVLGRAQEGRQ
jgi:hypothetical protein